MNVKMDLCLRQKKENLHEGECEEEFMHKTYMWKRNDEAFTMDGDIQEHDYPH